MNNIDSEVETQVARILQVGVQWIGLQRTAGAVLTALYSQECKLDVPLSAREISKATNLSMSTISTICSQLESLGIIVRQASGNSKGRGRRKAVFTLRVGVHDLLKIGIRKNIDQVRRIMIDIEILRNGTNSNSKVSQITINRVASEIDLFLMEPYAT